MPYLVDCPTPIKSAIVGRLINNPEHLLVA